MCDEVELSFQKCVFKWKEKDEVARETNINLKSSFVMGKRF